MHRSGEPQRFSITRFGAVAKNVLTGNGEGRVTAVFDRSFYVETTAGMACIVSPTLELGPLNAISSVPSGMNWQASGLRAGERVILSANTVYAGGRFVFGTDRARCWQPAPASHNWDRASLSNGLAKLGLMAGCRVPGDGLGRLVFRSGARCAESPLVRRAAEPVDQLCCWLGLAMAGDLAACDGQNNGVGQLLGLGPGLTPAGDDFLAGVLLALHALGQNRALSLLSFDIGCQMAERTGAISAAHLSAAMSGTGSAPLHLLLHDVMLNRGVLPNAALARVARIGHTSGWDCLAGMVAILRVWLMVECSSALASAG